MIKQTTQVPNILFDQHLPTLTEAELKVLLVIVRQTYGWIDRHTGKRKIRDRIAYCQFITKTGLSRRAITKAIQSLSEKHLINVTCYGGKPLSKSERRGKTSLHYMCTFRQEHVHLTTQTCAKCAHNKTNYTKETKTKGMERRSVRSIGEIIAGMAIKPLGTREVVSGVLE